MADSGGRFINWPHGRFPDQNWRLLPVMPPAPTLANTVFYLYNNENQNHRLAMWGAADRDMGLYKKDDMLNPDQQWVFKPSTDVDGYFIIENNSRTGHCVSVWGDDLEDVGVRPVSDGPDSSGQLWKISELIDGTYLFFNKLTPKSRMADSGGRFINWPHGRFPDQKWRFLSVTPPDPALANNVFYIYNKLNQKHRMAMWGLADRDMGVYTKDDTLSPDQKWVLKPSAAVYDYYIIENAFRAGHCISVWGNDLEDVGGPPGLEGGLGLLGADVENNRAARWHVPLLQQAHAQLSLGG